MIRSMTGFGRCEISEGNRKITVEMKSVNHRYLDVSIKMPKKLNFFDSAIRMELKKYAQRGKVDVFITYEDLSESNVALTYNKKVAAQYVEYFRQMEEQFGLKNDLSVSVLARCPEVLVMEEQQEDEEEIWHILEKALRGACEMFVETRVREGEALKKICSPSWTRWLRWWRSWRSARRRLSPSTGRSWRERCRSCWLTCRWTRAGSPRR